MNKQVGQILTPQSRRFAKFVGFPLKIADGRIFENWKLYWWHNFKELEERRLEGLLLASSSMQRHGYWTQSACRLKLELGDGIVLLFCHFYTCMRSRQVLLLYPHHQTFRLSACQHLGILQVATASSCQNVDPDVQDSGCESKCCNSHWVCPLSKPLEAWRTSANPDCRASSSSSVPWRKRVKWGKITFLQSRKLKATKCLQLNSYSKTFVLTLPLLERWWVINTYVLQGVNKKRDKLHGWIFFGFENSDVQGQRPSIWMM